MAETADWKQKYRDSVQEMQAEEARWRQTEQVLRRLVGRLCAAGMGHAPQLDDELAALAAANRRNAAAEELAGMADSLTSAVVAVDATMPVRAIGKRAPTAPSALIREGVGMLLNQLPASEDRVATQELTAELAAADSDEKLASVLRSVADLIEKECERLARERLQAGAVLSNVTRRLEDVARYLKSSDDATQGRYADAQSHNESVMWQVRELTGEVNSATELKALQHLVGERLERVTREVCDFRAREENRLIEYNGNAAQMRERIAELERQARDLNVKLDDEKQVARLDPLTNVANRKSYDERFQRELDLCRRGERAAALLLFDLDDFKSINDSYGHRAGDKVLQSVVKCFTQVAHGDDFVARLGGEEFVLLIGGVDPPEASQVGDRVRAAVESLRFHFRGTPVRITVSCGITQLRSDDSPEAAYDRADAALYRAKGAGKNACVAA